MLNKVVFDAVLYYRTAVTSILNRKTAFNLVCVLRAVVNRDGSPKRPAQFSDDDERCEGVKLFYLVLKVLSFVRFAEWIQWRKLWKKSSPPPYLRAALQSGCMRLQNHSMCKFISLNIILTVFVSFLTRCSLHGVLKCYHVYISCV